MVRGRDERSEDEMSYTGWMRMKEKCGKDWIEFRGCYKLYWMFEDEKERGRMKEIQEDDFSCSGWMRARQKGEGM